jgi:hypothetical protein
VKFSNVSGAEAGWTVGYERDGRELLIVIVKATYRLPNHGEQAEIAAKRVPLVQADEFTGEPGLTAPRYETDYGQRKPFCDVILLGNAHAPEGKEVRRLNVGLRVGAMTKQIAVVGNRTWHKGHAGVTAGDPQPFSVMPITYDHAFGGTDRTEESDKGLVHSYLANPVGRGYWQHTDGIDGQPLPNTESIDQSVSRHDGDYAPMSFSPIGRHWAPRTAYAGTYNADWLENDAPFWPKDFDYRYFQSAPTDQLIAYPQGAEQVVLQGLTADGHRTFRLPTRRMPVTFIPYRGQDATRDATLDTIVIEPELERFTLTWRTDIALGKSVFDVKETIAGDMSAGWHRARRFPGKTYYPSLAHAVAASRSESSS